MSTVRKTITLTDQQDDWIKAQIAAGQYTNDSEAIRDLIRREQERQAQVQAVRAVLDPMGFGESPVYPTLLFTSSEWGLFAKPIEIDGVRAMWAKKLIELVNEPGPLSPEAVRAIATQLSAKLPAKG